MRLFVGRFAAVAMLLSGFWIAGVCRAADAPADSAELRKVALAFAKAVHAGDLSAAKALAVATEKDMATLELVSKTWKTIDAFFEAIKVADPASDEQMQQMKSMLGIAEDLDKQIASAVVEIEGDRATLSDPPPTRKLEAATRPDARAANRDRMPDYGGEPVMLRKVDGKWKVDLDATFRAKVLDTEKGIAAWKELHDQLEQAIPKIKSGELKFPGRSATTRPSQP